MELLPGFETATATDELLVEIQAGSGVLSNDYPGGQGSDDMYGYYRYGFNGKENDNEVKGQGNQQDYGMRIYDPRVGRFLSVDPITKQYPELTPYQFASNKPINSIDLDGLEAKEVILWFDPLGNEIFKLEKKVNNPLGLGNGTIYYITTQHDIDVKQVNPSTVSFTRITVNTTAYVPKEKSLLDKVSDFINSGGGSQQEFGFVLTGNKAHSKASAFDLVSKANYKEHLDLELFIGVVGNLREFEGKLELMDLSEDLVGATN